MPTTSAPIVTAKDAIAYHVRWKMALQLSVVMQEPLGPGATDAIYHLEQCRIGQWIASRHLSAVRLTPEYRDLVARHKEFHREMQLIASMIEHRNFAAATDALEPNSKFQQISMALANAMSAIGRVQKGVIAA